MFNKLINKIFNNKTYLLSVSPLTEPLRVDISACFGSNHPIDRLRLGKMLCDVNIWRWIIGLVGQIECNLAARSQSVYLR